MDNPFTAGKTEKTLNNLLIALQEGEPQLEAASESLEEQNLASECYQLALLWKRIADELEKEIHRLGFLPKDVNIERATIKSWVTKMEGHLGPRQHILKEKIKTIVEHVQKNALSAKYLETSVIVLDIIHDLDLQNKNIVQGLDASSCG